MISVGRKDTTFLLWFNFKLLPQKESYNPGDSCTLSAVNEGISLSLSFSFFLVANAPHVRSVFRDLSCHDKQPSSRFWISGDLTFKVQFFAGMLWHWKKPQHFAVRQVGTLSNRTDLQIHQRAFITFLLQCIITSRLISKHVIKSLEDLGKPRIQIPWPLFPPLGLVHEVNRNSAAVLNCLSFCFWACDVYSRRNRATHCQNSSSKYKALKENHRFSLAKLWLEAVSRRGEYVLLTNTMNVIEPYFTSAY